MIRYFRTLLLLRRLRRAGLIVPDGKGRYRLTTKGQLANRLDIYGRNPGRTPHDDLFFVEPSAEAAAELEKFGETP